MARAPVCNVNQSRKPVNVVGPSLPPIPIATDLPSAIAAINALKQAITIINNSTTPSNPNGSGGGGFSETKNNNFAEVRPKRVTQTVRIYNPQDKNQFVDVNQITGLTFLDDKTNQTIVWKQ